MILKTLLSAASALAISASVVTAGEIEVVGNVKVDRDFVASAFPDKPGYTDGDIDRSVKELFSSGAFNDIRVDRVGSGLRVTVEETPVVVNVVFNGNRRLDDAKLASASGLDSGTPFDPSRLEEVSARIRTAYGATGRRVVGVTHQIVQRDGGFYDVAFRIEEGERSVTTDIWFEGNAAFGDAELSSVISTKRTGLLSKVFSRDVIDIDRLDADRRKLVKFYRSKGYADVAVSEPEVDFDPDGRNGMAGFRITEGPRYGIGTVTLDNTTGFAVPEKAASKAEALRGRVYDSGKVDDVADGIAASVEAATGSPVSVNVRPERSGGTANIVFTVDERSRVYVERIEISGNAVTRDYVIRREIDLSEGDLYNPRLAKEAERRLSRLPFLDSVRITTARGSAEDRVVLKVEVIERKSGEFSVGGAYSAADGPLAIISLEQSNFGGTGRAFSVSAGRGSESGNYGFSFTEPHIFGTGLSGTAQLFRRDYDSREGGFRPYEETVDGAKVSLRGPLSAKQDLTVYYSLSRSSRRDIDADVADSLVPAEDHVISSVGYEWFISDLDDERNPSDGYRVSISQEFAGIGGDARFVRSEISARAYRELSDRHGVVGSLSGRAGHVTGIGGDLAFADHFRSVGDLVRGFETGGFGPRDSDTGYLAGGRFYAGLSAEAVYPVPFLTDTLGLKGSVFADAGSVWSADPGTVRAAGADVRFDGATLRAALGTGLVWDSPIGLFKATVAMPVAEADGDRTRVFSISGGTRF